MLRISVQEKKRHFPFVPFKSKCAPDLMKKLYNKPRRANDIKKKIHSMSSRGQCTLLPPFDSWSSAFAASAGFAGALGAREELGHQLGDVRQLGVGVQHVHGLLHFLSHFGVVGVDNFGQKDDNQQR